MEEITNTDSNVPNETQTDKKYTTVSLPRPLYEKVKEQIRNTGFTSVSDYVTYVLRALLSKEKEEGADKEEAFSKKDEQNIKDRLKALGYLD